MLKLLFELLLQKAHHLNPRLHGHWLLVTFNPGMYKEVEGACVMIREDDLQIHLTGSSHRNTIFNSKNPQFDGPMTINCASCMMLKIIKLSKNSRGDATCEVCAERMRQAEETAAPALVEVPALVTPLSKDATDENISKDIRDYIEMHPTKIRIPVQTLYNKLKCSYPSITMPCVRRLLNTVQTELQTKKAAAA
jgi:hypothetical protein